VSSVYVIRLILLVMTAGFSFSQSACNYGRNIHFILPDGFTGRFEVVLDEVNGSEIGFENGRYTYEIPQSGILKVKSFEPFQHWHTKTAAYQSGRRISDSSEVDSNTIALRSVGGSGSRNIGGTNVGPTILGYAIGTEDQARKLIDKELTQTSLYPEVCFVLPEGYRGAFQLILDEHNGLELAMEDGCYTYEIPESGAIAVKTLRPLQEPHVSKARYKNGSIIPSEDSTVRPDVIALRSLGTSRINDGALTQTSVIGNLEEAERARRDLVKQKLKVGKQ
jgi:hypothetical protein